MRTGFDVVLTPDGRARHHLFRTASPGRRGTSLVTFAADPMTGAACLLLGRLHYRHDLRSTLPHPGRAFAEDAALALAAFLAHGPEGLVRLEGEFAVVVSDPARRCLFARRDPLGSWPLFWFAEGGALHVGTSLIDLARQSSRTRVNADFLGSFLMWPFAGAELPEEQTALGPLRRVPPGHLLALRPDGTARTLAQPDWLAGAELADISPEEAGERFAALFRAAVHERLEPGTTAAHLSGGLDSSSVVCVARQLSAAPLATLSLVYRMPSLAGETDYIRLVLDQGGPLEPHFLDGDDLLDFDWFDEAIPAHDEPYGGLCQLAMERRLVEAAAAAGSTTILTGGGAEVTADGSRAHLADLLCRGRWVAAWREALRWARAANEGPWAVLRRNGLDLLVPGRLRDGLGTLLRRGQGRWPRLGMSAVPPWVRSDFARRHDLWDRGHSAVARLYRSPYEQSANLFGIRCEAGEWSTWYLTGPRGIQTGRPFLDPRLVAFSQSLPRRVRVVPGVAKPVLQLAMRGVLPEPIRTRRWKRNFNDVYWRGLARRLPRLEEMVRRSAISSLGIFDVDCLLEVMRQTAAGIGDIQAGGRLNSSLALVAWFDQVTANLRQPADRPDQTFSTSAPTRAMESDHVLVCS